MEPEMRVAVVIASSRPTRICPSVAATILGRLRDPPTEYGGVVVHYEAIDLAEVDLPFLDEPQLPALGHYEHEHTKAWSKLVSGFDGFVFVLPQYNWGYPAILKNALDFLYREWAGKPVTYATYGSHGGGLAAAQIREVLDGLRMRELEHHLEIVITIDDYNADGTLKSPEGVVAPYRDQIARIRTQMREALAVPT